MKIVIFYTALIFIGVSSGIILGDTISKRQIKNKTHQCKVSAAFMYNIIDKDSIKYVEKIGCFKKVGDKFDLIYKE